MRAKSMCTIRCEGNVEVGIAFTHLLHIRGNSPGCAARHAVALPCRDRMVACSALREVFASEHGLDAFRAAVVARLQTGTLHSVGSLSVLTLLEAGWEKL